VFVLPSPKACDKDEGTGKHCWVAGRWNIEWQYPPEKRVGGVGTAC
jgi:hypothetical protein